MANSVAGKLPSQNAAMSQLSQSRNPLRQNPLCYLITPFQKEYPIIVSSLSGLGYKWLKVLANAVAVKTYYMLCGMCEEIPD